MNASPAGDPAASLAPNASARAGIAAGVSKDSRAHAPFGDHAIVRRRPPLTVPFAQFQPLIVAASEKGSQAAQGGPHLCIDIVLTRAAQRASSERRDNAWSRPKRSRRPPALRLVPLRSSMAPSRPCDTTEGQAQITPQDEDPRQDRGQELAWVPSS
jgi:hypothetical protein